MEYKTSRLNAKGSAMEIGIREDGKYELEIFERINVITHEQLDELHELIESVNAVEHRNREAQITKRGLE